MGNCTGFFLAKKQNEIKFERKFNPEQIKKSLDFTRNLKIPKFESTPNITHIILIQKHFRRILTRKKLLISYPNYKLPNLVKTKNLNETPYDDSDPLNEPIDNKKRKYKEFPIDLNKIYLGEWKNQMREGIGILKWSDGSVYKGNFIENKANGYGKLYHSNNEYYEGMWIEDKALGIGVYGDSKGGIYQGFWQADKQYGYGIETWSNGSCYEGYYKEGEKEGFGVLAFNDGSIYSGEFANNNIEGIGTLVFSDKRVYQGHWKNNKMNGYGILKWPNGQYFEGAFINDKKSGFGIYVTSSRVFLSYWENSKLNGEVIVIEKGIVKKFIYDKGNKIKNLDDDYFIPYEKYTNIFL